MSGGVLGMGLGGNFSSAALPLLNLFNTNFGWLTSSSTFDTGEESYLQTDADGYVTSLTASPTPPGGQLFTFVQTLLYHDLFGSRTPPNTSVPFPAGNYTLTWQGAGTMLVLAQPDVDYNSIAVTQGGANVSFSVSSNIVTITSTLTAGDTGAISFNVTTPTHGIVIQLTAIAAGNYFKALGCVPTAQLSAWRAGQYVNPAWVNLVKNFKCLRFMDWQQTNNSTPAVTLASAPGNGATSAALATPWTQPSGQYYFAFDTSDEVVATFTVNSTSVTWTGGLSKAGTGTTAYYSTKPISWAARPKATRLFWNHQDFGPPMEAMTQVLNQTGCDGWFCVPPEMLNADITAMLNFLNSNLTTGGSTVYLESGNETWNSGFNGANYASFRGNALWGAGNSPAYSYTGKRTADLADIAQSINSSRFKVIMGGQRANTFIAQQKLTAPAWVANGGTIPWSAHAIAGICIDQYWNGNNYPPGWLLLTQPNFLTNFFGEAQGGGVIAGGYPGGQIQAPLDGLKAHVSSMNLSFGHLPVYCYEGDPNTDAQESFLICMNGSQGPWHASSGFSWGSVITDSNGNPQQVTFPAPGGGNGQTGLSAPAWATAPGSTTTDNGVIWTRIQNVAVPWVANKTWALYDVVKDSNGNMQVCSTGGLGGSGTPAWAVSAGTTTDNVAVWTYPQGADGRQDSMFFAYLAAADTDSRIATPLLTWLRQFYANGGVLLHYFVELGIFSKYGNWSAGESLLQSPVAPKLQTLLDYVAGGGPPPNSSFFPAA